jgi:DNA-binding NtrC family response regulator
MFDFFDPKLFPQYFGLDPRKILVVEDDPFLKPLITGIVHSVDHEARVRWVADVDSAKYLLSCEPFKLVISDFVLDGPENGYDLWKFCKDRFPAVAFVMVSALSRQVLSSYFAMHAVLEAPPLLSKPLRPRICQDLLFRVLKED